MEVDGRDGGDPIEERSEKIKDVEEEESSDRNTPSVDGDSNEEEEEKQATRSDLL